MAEVKVYYDRTGNTLTVWFGDRQEEYLCEETGDESDLGRLLMRDQSGQGALIRDVLIPGDRL